jgi:hypothetical protein
MLFIGPLPGREVCQRLGWGFSVSKDHGALRKFNGSLKFTLVLSGCRGYFDHVFAAHGPIDFRDGVVAVAADHANAVIKALTVGVEVAGHGVVNHEVFAVGGIPLDQDVVPYGVWDSTGQNESR